MSRFGDFTLLEDLGQSATADRYKATHATLGGPFFLKVYRRLDPAHLAELAARGDRLIGQSHPNLAPHLGHGVVDGVGFAVSPWLEGIDLIGLSASLKDRRVNLSLDQCLLIVGDVGTAVAALHAVAPAPTGSRLAHGDVSIGHVRVGPEGQVWLTGLTTPRGLVPGRVPEARFDLAGAGALIYDLVPLLRGGAARPPLPTPLDRVMRRALGIGPATEHLTPVDFVARLGEVFANLKLNSDRAPLIDVIRRTLRAVEKRLTEQGPRPGGQRTAADAIPELLPVNAPASVRPVQAPAPASVSSLVPPPAAPRTPPFAAPSLLAPPAPVGPSQRALSAVFSAPPADDMFRTGSASRTLLPDVAPLDPTARVTPARMPPTSTPSPFSNDLGPPLTASPFGNDLLDPFGVGTPRMAAPPVMAMRGPPVMAAPFEAPSPQHTSMPLADRDDARPSFVSGDADVSRPVRVSSQLSMPSVQVLLRSGLVREDQVETAANEQATRGGRTLEILVAHGACSDGDVATALALAAERPRLQDDTIVVKDAALLKRLPQTYALARRLLPLALDAGTLILAVADPFEKKVIDEVRDLVHALDVDVRVAARAALTQATLRAFADLNGAALAATGPRVLLGIEDDDLAQKLGARFAQEGMQVEHVVDGATARQILQTRPPDAFVCTWQLPKVDGQALLLAVRANERTSELPVFVLGPRGDDELMSKALDLGADDYFGAPVRPDVIVAKLRRAIGKLAGRTSSPPVAAPPPPPAAAPPLPRTVSRAGPPPLPKRTPVAPPPSDEFAFDDLPDLPPEFDHQPPEVPSMPTGVMGTLRQMSLPEIVQSLEMGRKTASVDIVPQDGEKGSIAFEGGAIRFAECAGLIGNQAFFLLMRHKEGFFRIHYGDAPKSTNIEAPTTFLLLEAMRLMDEEGQ
jgi:CheY-like chemotaxis protein